ncbi:methyltransferase [Mangrovicella endophytica]|uniref:methyltransferase n=1 Tax=Mangrovicella endophytica TaxID=2066697 RepID=UPI000C9EAF97|nr:methyltransferase [Mangrovicella endophytica]
MSIIDDERLADAYNKGLSLERAGDRDGAATAYRQCLTLDPADHGGAAVRLAALGLGDVPDKAPDAYVATLFDQHADVFEDMLVRQLRYEVPSRLAAHLLKAGPFNRVLDLGCGTGLVGEALRDRSEEIVGVDLSESMVELCDEKEIYDHLFVGEAVSFLGDDDGSGDEDEDGGGGLFDVVTAADVLPYLGDLDPLVGGVARRLVPGGRFGFSTETMSEERLAGRAFTVGPGQRFHHSDGYVRDCLDRHGFDIETFEPITVRLQEGEPAPGHLVVAQRRGGGGA